MKVVRIAVLFLVMAALFSTSCRRELETSWDVNYYGPVGQTRITLGNLFGEEHLNAGTDQLLNLIYEDTLFSLDLDSLMDIQDTLSSNKLDVPFALALAPGQKVLQATDETVMDIDDALFTSARTKDARIRIETQSTVKQDLLIKYTIPSAKRNGIAFEMTAKVAAADTGTVIQTDYLELQGYDFDFTGASGIEVNTLITTTELWVHPDADTLRVVAGDKVYVNTFLEKLELDYAQGYFGSDEFHIRESSALGLFDQFPQGSIQMDSVKGELRIINKVGMDARLRLNELSAVNHANMSSASFNHSLTSTTFNISRATDVWGTVTPFETVIDLAQNNIHQLINLKPDSIRYDLLFHMNPLGNAAMNNDFIYAGKGLDVLLELQTPLNIAIDNLMWVDTMDLNTDNLKGVQSGSFRLETSNMFPYNLDLQMILLNGDKALDSLNTDGIHIQTATLDTDLAAHMPSLQTHEIPVSAQQIVHLKNTDRILVRVLISDPQTVQRHPLRANNHLDMNLKADFIYRVNDDE